MLMHYCIKNNSKKCCRLARGGTIVIARQEQNTGRIHHRSYFLTEIRLLLSVLDVTAYPVISLDYTDIGRKLLYLCSLCHAMQTPIYHMHHKT